jgi:hypothetical protein
MAKSTFLLTFVLLGTSVTASFAAGSDVGDQFTREMVGKPCTTSDGRSGVWHIACLARKPPVSPGPLTCTKSTLECWSKSFGPAPTPKKHE